MARLDYSKSIHGHEHAQVRVDYFTDGTIELISYTTKIITVTPDGWLSCTGTYSATTRKHIGWFMRQLSREKSVTGLGYYLAKKMYEDEKEYNIKTGEVRSLRWT